MVVVRHAERMDETERACAFYQTCGDRWWDPPLSREGETQARDVGRRLAAMYPNGQFSAVMCSPTLRTVQTAAYIAAELGLPLRRVPGLAECAAQVCKHGISRFRGGETSASFQGVPAFKSDTLCFLSEEACTSLCAPGTRFLPADTTYDQFEPCLKRVAIRSRARRELIVSHREGIREIRMLAGSRDLKTPYCCISSFELIGGSKWIVTQCDEQSTKKS